MAKLGSVAAGVFLAATLIASAARADGPDISAQRLLSSWHDEDPGMRIVAEVIASAFASGFSWTLREAHSVPLDSLEAPPNEQLGGGVRCSCHSASASARDDVAIALAPGGDEIGKAAV